jgi:hypothetical protein
MAETIEEKQRQRYAKKKVIKLLNNAGYEAFSIDNGIFTIQAEREKEIRKIKVVLNEINDRERNLVKNSNPPQICTKEIWIVRKDILGKLIFEKVLIS